MTVKTKLLLALSVILLASFTATSVINYTVTRDSIREELINSSLPLTGKNIYSEIHSAMMRPILVSSSMANDTFLKSWVTDGERDPLDIVRYLEELRGKHGFLTAFFVSASSDKYYYNRGILKRISPRDSHDVWYYAFVGTGKEYDLVVDTNQAEDNRLTIFINFRVEDAQGRLLGVTGVGVSMDNAITLLEDARQAYGRNVFLTDQDGLVQVHTDRTRIQRMYITETPGIAAVAAGILEPHENARSFEYDHDGDHILVSARYLPEFEWHLIVEQDEGAALASARNNLIRTLSVGLGASLLIISLCVVTVNHFQARLERMAKTDPLTGAANRRALTKRFDLARYRAARHTMPFSVIVIDLDEFKAINDTLGHIEGDRVLKAVASAIARTLRPTDLLVRWGGDEFLILMDGAAEEAEVVAERVRAAMPAAPSGKPISFSCGIAQFRDGDDLNSLTQRADEAMYKAKTTGSHCDTDDRA
ncbi:diguanylate cyclase [Pseudodesulfovibrio sp. F-1]|uniref:diguanylate cyclase n=1 Tax=Pseudodesulfovibrio alkaliphilus TaxID=2661613 RepID=A0A7K1KMJ6_9BACT|nr:sensor domain-containing diguanylate cyclase [Pseudodesulfovibrio alkaliphilus]MUM77092.1 diguanylate cyclase [Pseudodesulfovibrio alkaliphilus]